MSELVETVNKEHHNIILRGKNQAIDEFVYVFKEVVSKTMPKEELNYIITEIKNGKFQHNPIDLTSTIRLYYKPSEIKIAINHGNKEFYFPLIEKPYQEAKKLYEERTNNKIKN